MLHWHRCFAKRCRPPRYVLVIDGPIASDLDTAIRRWERGGARVKVVRLAANVGLARALNEGLQHCSEEYIARMDADDVSEPHRFSVEATHLDASPDTALVGGWYRQFDAHMKVLESTRRVPEHHHDLVRYARHRTPFNHVTAMFRRSAVLDVGGYPTKPGLMEDWWLALYLMRRGYRLHNIQEYLVNVRGGAGFFGRRGGRHYLRSELSTLWEMHACGFHSLPTFLINGAIRGVMRLAPSRLRVFGYRLVRRVP